MNSTLSIIGVIWLIGFALCYGMLRVEHEADGQKYTKGDRVLNVVFSLLSVVMIMIILIQTWIKKIGNTGYWNKPVNEQAKDK